MAKATITEKEHLSNVDQLKKLVRKFVSKYHSYNRRVEVGLNFSANKTQKDNLRKRPMRLCPTCRKAPHTNTSYWVADHRPPQALSAGPYTLWPQCCLCSARQSAAVKKRKAGLLLTPQENNLITVPVAAYQPVSVTGCVTAANRSRINTLGKSYGCITCGGRSNPATVADHFMPAAFNRSYVEKVFKKIGISAYLRDKYIVEQCWHCSNKQSSEVAAIIYLTRRAAKYLKITVY